PLPAGLADMERESGGQRQHVVAQTVGAAVAVEVLKGGRAGEFRDGAYPSGDAVLPLYAVGDRKRVVPVRSMMQQADARKGN
ncbi:hypothetical protein, partial [Salmonella sp. gx-f7]|uniref:hypothetical protein n=1 Tax=Salmonella sp. gx-f7 TaxID=2582606 RepID=UPI001929B7CE